MPSCRRTVALFIVVMGIVGWASGLGAQPGPTGEVVWAWHVTITPAWFDPADTPAQITPFGMLYALHDAVVRPLPGERMGNSLAASWTESPDGLAYTWGYEKAVYTAT